MHKKTDPDGVVVGATVEAKNMPTGKVYTAAGERGDFTYQLSGTYQVSVPLLGFRTGNRRVR